MRTINPQPKGHIMFKFSKSIFFGVIAGSMIGAGFLVIFEYYDNKETRARKARLAQVDKDAQDFLDNPFEFLTR